MGVFSAYVIFINKLYIMAKIVRLTESDMTKLVEKILSEQVTNKKIPNGAVRTTPAEEFIGNLYKIADKYRKVNIILTFDGKYIVGTETNTGQKYTITVT